MIVLKQLTRKKITNTTNFIRVKNEVTEVIIIRYKIWYIIIKPFLEILFITYRVLRRLASFFSNYLFFNNGTQQSDLMASVLISSFQHFSFMSNVVEFILIRKIWTWHNIIKNQANRKFWPELAYKLVTCTS